MKGIFLTLASASYYNRRKLYLIQWKVGYVNLIIYASWFVMTIGLKNITVEWRDAQLCMSSLHVNLI